MEVLKKQFIFSENSDYNIILNLKSNHKLIGLYNSFDDEIYKEVIDTPIPVNDVPLNIVDLEKLNIVNQECSSLMYFLWATMDNLNKNYANKGDSQLTILLNDSLIKVEEKRVIENKLNSQLNILISKYKTNIIPLKNNLEIKDAITALIISLYINLTLSNSIVNDDYPVLSNTIKIISERLDYLTPSQLFNPQIFNYGDKIKERGILLLQAIQSFEALLVSINIKLTPKSEVQSTVINVYKDNKQDLTSSNNVIITAITDSKLNDIRGYDNNEPFKVGVNGVTVINDTFIKYIIDDIEYTTTYSGNIQNLTPIQTTYTTTNNIVNGIDNNSVNKFIYKDERDSYIERGKKTNNIFLERSPIAINDFFFRLNHINTADDFPIYFN